MPTQPGLDELRIGAIHHAIADHICPRVVAGLPARVPSAAFTTLEIGAVHFAVPVQSPTRGAWAFGSNRIW